MKIKLLNSGGYRGLEHVIFPVIVEARQVDDGGAGLAFVPFITLLNFQEFFWHPKDADEGDDYTFYPEEYELVRESTGIPMWDGVKELTKGVEVDLDAPLKDDE